jgi:flagellar FliL protein
MAEEAEDTKTEAPQPASAASGGIKAWLPLLLTLLLMPALAYATTMFVLLPKLQKGLAGEAQTDTGKPPSQSGTVKANARESSPAKPKTKVPLSKIVVNVSGSQGTRLLLTSLTLAGGAADFKARIEDNLDQLRDLASGILGSKSISDLEKPESRNLIRSELVSQFNAALGNGVVQEIYITEFAIQ